MKKIKVIKKTKLDLNKAKANIDEIYFCKKTDRVTADGFTILINNNDISDGMGYLINDKTWQRLTVAKEDADTMYVVAYKENVELKDMAEGYIFGAEFGGIEGRVVYIIDLEKFTGMFFN